ncbi:hypothetical protein PM082_011604 [Marasmius tenuissimus]|nr:hypothetical protein PM082_011604 [Marasmius tenuissimus]
MIIKTNKLTAVLLSRECRKRAVQVKHISVGRSQYVSTWPKKELSELSSRRTSSYNVGQTSLFPTTMMSSTVIKTHRANVILHCYTCRKRHEGLTRNAPGDAFNRRELSE